MENNPEAEEDDAPSFFKFLADDSLDHLPISPAFVEKYMEGDQAKYYPKNPIFIMNESNQTWTVKIAQIGHKHYFVNGWLRFVEDNGLKTGDFIVFWLIAHSTFQVAIYGPSCCEKRSVNPRAKEAAGGRSGHQKKKPKVEYEFFDGLGSGSAPAESHPCCSREIAKSHQYLVPLTSTFAREVGIERKKKLVLRDEKGKEWEVGVVVRNNSYYLTRGWFYFRKANKVEVGDTCLFTFPTPPRTPTATPLLDVNVLRKPRRKRGRPRVRASASLS